MARDGYRIFDSDTHVGPDAAILSQYLSAAEKQRLAAGPSTKRATATAGSPTPRVSDAIAAASGTPSRIPGRPGTWPVYRRQAQAASRRRGSIADPAARIADMISKASNGI